MGIKLDESGKIEVGGNDMDKAAIEARGELDTLDPEAIKVVREWWLKWYLRSGHKRLGRALIGKL